MKVLLIGPFPPPVNGCSIANETLYQELLKKAVTTTTINTSAHINHSHHGKFTLGKFTSFLHVYLKVYWIKFCDVVYFTPGQTFFGMAKYAPFILCCILLKKPYVIHVHGNYFGKEYRSLTGIKKRLFHTLVSRSSAGIVLSGSLRENFSGLLPRSKIHVVTNFVETNLFGYGCIEKKDDKIRILYLSNLLKEKGIFELLEAIRGIREKGIDFEAILAGSIDDKISSEINIRLAELGERVKYIGTISGEEKKKQLLNANVLILPTYYKMEGQPIALLEGMATGNIIITTNHAGIPDIITAANGFLIKCRSAEEIQLHLEQMNADIPGMLKMFSSFNRNYAARTFTVSIFVNNILTILHAIAKSK